MAIVYRNAGAWGSGKGAPLTSTEVDNNFYEHELRVTEIEENPPLAVGIASINVVGNQITFNLTDASTLGPFLIPTAQWSWKGEWAPSRLYRPNDVISFAGRVYLILVGHTSDASFDPAAESIDGFYYNLVMETADQPYDIGLYYGDIIPDDGRIMLQHCVTRDIIIEANFGISTAFLEQQVFDGDLVLEIYKNDVQIGTLTFTTGEDVLSPDGQFGVFASLSPAEDITFTRRDRLSIKAPETSDSLPYGLSITIAARVQSITSP